MHAFVAPLFATMVAVFSLGFSNSETHFEHEQEKKVSGFPFSKGFSKIVFFWRELSVDNNRKK